MSAQLKVELRAALNEVKHQEQHARASALSDDLNPYSVRYPSGEFLLAPFISAKTQLLCALASLETK